MNKDDDEFNLKRVTFERLISDAYLDYLFCEGINAEYYALGGEFCPTDTPNRNDKQVPNGIWRRVLSRHLNKKNYN